MRPWMTGLLLVLLSLPVHAADTPFQSWRAHAARTLLRRADSDARVTAAVLMWPGRRATANHLIHDAALAHPDDRVLASLDTLHCMGQAGCDAVARARRWQRIDPDNAAAWIAPLHRARSSGDVDAVDSVLEHMARARRFDLRLAPLGRRLRRQLQALPPPPAAGHGHRDDWAGVYALSAMAAQAVPPIQDIVRVCHQPDMSRGRTDACRRLGRIMQTSDALIGQYVGLRLLAWSARTAAERAIAATRQRTLDWRQYQLSTLANDGRDGGRRQAKALLDHDREIDAVDSLLRAAHRRLQPPQGWKDPARS